MEECEVISETEKCNRFVKEMIMYSVYVVLIVFCVVSIIEHKFEISWTVTKMADSEKVAVIAGFSQVEACHKTADTLNEPMPADEATSEVETLENTYGPIKAVQNGGKK